MLMYICKHCKCYEEPYCRMFRREVNTHDFCSLFVFDKNKSTYYPKLIFSSEK